MIQWYTSYKRRLGCPNGLLIGVRGVWDILLKNNISNELLIIRDISNVYLASIWDAELQGCLGYSKNAQ